MSLLVIAGPLACAPENRPATEPGAGGSNPTTVSSPTQDLQPTPPPEASCLFQGGTVETHSVETAHLDGDLQLRIYLPPCYAVEQSSRYPVLYLLHGQTYTDDQWIRLGVAELADRLIAAGELDGFIIVLPFDPLWRQPDAYGFNEAFIEDLLPYVEANYRSRPGRRYRAVGGLSRGAGWALHFGFSRPDLFGSLGAHSPVVFWEDAPHLDDWLGELSPQTAPRIYLDIGENDLELDAARALEVMLDDFDLPHEWHLNTGFHDEIYWRSHLEEYLRWYAAGW